MSKKMNRNINFSKYSIKEINNLIKKANKVKKQKINEGKQFLKYMSSTISKLEKDMSFSNDHTRKIDHLHLDVDLENDLLMLEGPSSKITNEQFK